MDLLTTIIIFCVVFTLVSEWSTYVTYGRFLKDEEVVEYIKKYKSFSINQFEHSIISGDIDWSNTDEVMKKILNGDFISTTRMSVLSKYYIQGYGRVRSWSDGAKMIDKLYKTSPIR
jgi:hypothetical protein